MANWVLNTIPNSFDFAQHLSYFEDLNRPRNIGMGNIKSMQLEVARKKLYQQAQNSLTGKLLAYAQQADGEEESDKISKALDFLIVIAESERSKELQILDTYLAKFKKNPHLTDYVDELERTKNITVNEHLDRRQLYAFHRALTRLMNAIRQEHEVLQTRLEQIQRNAKTQATFSDQLKTNMHLRAHQDADLVIKRLNGSLAKDIDYNYIDMLTEGVLAAIDKLDLRKLEINSHTKFASLLIALVYDIDDYLQRHHLDQDVGALASQEENQKIIQKEIKAYYNNLNAKVDKNVSNFNTHLRDNDLQIAYILEAAGRGSFLHEAKGKKLEKKQRLQNDSEIENKQYRDSMQTNLKSKYPEIFDDKFFEQFNKLELEKAGETKFINEKGVKSSYSTQHGFSEEIYLTLQRLLLGLRTDSNAATDNISIIPAGTLEFSTAAARKRAQRKMQQPLEKIKAAMNERAEKIIDMEDRERLEATKEQNKNIQAAEKIMKKVSKEYGDDEFNKFFTFHDSAKFYTTIESKRTQEFNGRTISIFNALDSLYSENGFQEAGLPNYDEMITLALNLTSENVQGASENLEPLQRILSIFVGLLFFDDTGVMIKDAKAEFDNRGSSIHFYNLNGIAVPSSIILSYIAYNIRYGWRLYNARKVAKVTIDTKGASAIIQKHLDYIQNPENDYLDNYAQVWHELAEKIGLATKVKIKFFSAFLNFVSNLLNNFDSK